MRCVLGEEVADEDLKRMADAAERIDEPTTKSARMSRRRPSRG